MKKFIFGLLTIVGLLSFGCRNLAGNKVEGGKAYISLSVDTTRSIQPVLETSDITKAILRYKPVNESTYTSLAENTYEGIQQVSVAINPGAYDFLLELYTSFDGIYVPCQEGTIENKEISAGQNILDFTTKYLSTGSGSLELQFQWPASAGIVSVKAALYTLEDGKGYSETPYTGCDLEELTIIEGATSSALYEKSLPAGNYFLKFQAFQINDHCDTYTDIVKIKAGCITSATIEYTQANTWLLTSSGNVTVDNRALTISMGTGRSNSDIYLNDEILFSAKDSSGKTVSGVSYGALLLYKGIDVNSLAADATVPYYTVAGNTLSLNGENNPLPSGTYLLYVTASRKLSDSSTSTVTSSQTFEIKMDGTINLSYTASAITAQNSTFATDIAAYASKPAIKTLALSISGELNDTEGDSLELSNFFTTFADAFSDIDGVAVELDLSDVDGVTYLPSINGDNAALDISTLTKVILPNTLETINQDFGSSPLASITIPASVTSVELTQMYSLQEIIVDPDNANYESVYDNSLLVSVAGADEGTLVTAALASPAIETLDFSKVPEITTIPEGQSTTGTFSSSTTLKNITSFGNFTEIPTGTFAYCEALEEVNLSGIESIGESAFAYCKKLTSPDFTGVTSIGHSAFNGCSALESAILSDVTELGNYAFQSCTSLKSVALEKLTSLDATSFKSCTALESLDLTGITSIPAESFKEFTSLKTVIAPDATSIGTRAFDGCSALENVTAPNITTVQDYAFQNCSLLESISSTSFTSIGMYAFNYCEKLSDITLTNVTSLGTDAFYGCKALTSISFGSLTELSSNSFSYCTSLTTIDLTGITKLGISVFEGCTSLESIDLKQVTTLVSHCFKDCTKLSSITIPSTVTQVGMSCFEGCSSLTSVTFETPTGWKCNGTDATVSVPATNATNLTTSGNDWQKFGLTRS